MTPVLIVSYYFPPHGGAGTQRYAKFAKYLPEFGIRPIVICAAVRTTQSAPSADESLVAEIPPVATVVRVPEDSPPRLSLFRRAALAARFRIDAEEWVGRAWPIVREAARAHAARAIITTVSPYAAAQLGRAAKRELGLPWILDLRDPWALDGWRSFRTYLHALYDRRAMRTALRAADLVVASVPAAKEAYAQLGRLAAARIWTIPNGFDDDDFSDMSSNPAGEAFRIVHTGTLHSAEPDGNGAPRGAGRFAWRRIEPAGRSGRFLYLAIAELKRRRPDLYARVRVELFGQVHSSHHDLAAQLGIGDRIVVHPYVSHRAAVAAMCSADCIFVPLHGIPAGERALVVPGKLYEALASDRMVLGCLPAGDAAELIRGTGAGVVCAPDDVAGIADCLMEHAGRWGRGQPWEGGARRCMTPFLRRNLAAMLAEAVKAVVGGGPRSAPDDPWVLVSRTVDAARQPAGAVLASAAIG